MTLKNFFLLLLLALLTVVSCKKDLPDLPLEETRNEAVARALANLKTQEERDFFDWHFLQNTNPYLFPIPVERNDAEDLLQDFYEYLLLLNQDTYFATTLISQYGYPIWSRSKTYSVTTDLNGAVLTPLAKTDSKNITSYLFGDHHDGNWRTSLITHAELDSLILAHPDQDTLGLGFHVAAFLNSDRNAFGSWDKNFKDWIWQFLSDNDSLQTGELYPRFSWVVHCELLCRCPFQFQGGGGSIEDRGCSSGGDGCTTFCDIISVSCPPGWDNGWGGGGTTIGINIGGSPGDPLPPFGTSSPNSLSQAVQQIISLCQQYAAANEPGGIPPNEIPGGYNSETACKCEQFLSIHQHVPLSSEHLTCLFQQANCSGNNAIYTLSNYVAHGGTAVDPELIAAFLQTTKCGSEGLGFKQFEILYKKVMALKEVLGLTQGEVLWLLSQEATDIANTIHLFLVNKNYDDASRLAGKKLIGVIKSGLLNGPYPAEQRDAIIEDYGFADPATYYEYVTWCVILTNQWIEQHPGQTCNNLCLTGIALEAYWKAIRGEVHIALDLCGLIPGFGELCDGTNGVLYLIEGDGVNAAFSFAATIPVAGWVATGAKYARIAIKTPSGIVVTLTAKALNGVIDFGNRSDLRKVMEIMDNTMDTHHVIPWGKRTHKIVQHAAKSADVPFHMNHAKNGRAVKKFRFDIPDGIHANHPQYDDKVQNLLEDKWNYLINQYGSEAAIPVKVASQELRDLQNYIAGVIDSNPNVKINDLQF